MLIDTHCHLDASEFDANRAEVIAQALASGVTHMVIPAIMRQNFDTVIQLCDTYPACAYALGIHPMYVEHASFDDLQTLDFYIKNNHPVAIGEIGLDYFDKTKQTQTNHTARQTTFFVEQLKLAQHYQLPVILHVRGAIDDVLKQLRRHAGVGGIAHAFNGSLQQAEQFIALGFKLGFGGAMTHTRALKIRALAQTLPLESIVLETDAPDIPPAWIKNGDVNTPAALEKIAKVLADLKQVSVSQVLDITSANALKILPKLA